MLVVGAVVGVGVDMGDGVAVIVVDVDRVL